MGLFNFIQIIDMQKKLKEQKKEIKVLREKVQLQEILIKKFTEEIKDVLTGGN